MAANCCTVQHVLPIVCKAEFDKRFQERIPYPLLGPAPKPDINGIPLSVSLTHITPRAANPKHVPHAVYELAVIMGRARLTPALCRKKRFHDLPFRVSKITSCHNCLLKGSLESDLR